MLEGIDLSSWEPTTPSLAGRSFVIARATYGPWVDRLYTHHVGVARAAGLVTGAYAFGIAGDVPAQVAAFLAAAGDVDLLALDLETESGKPPMTNAEGAAFIAAVQGAGRRCGLYHSRSGYPELGQDWRWVADWSTTPPGIPWDVWQHRGSPLDLDSFAGTPDQLRALGRGANMKAITDETPATMTVAAGTQLYDLDGTTELNATGGKWTTTTPLRPSPFRCGTQAAMYISYPNPGTRRLALVSPVAGTLAPLAAGDYAAGYAAARAAAGKAVAGI